MDKQPWERMSGESAIAYKYFEAYLQMDPTERSMDAVGKKYGVTQKAIEAHGLRHNWTERVKAWEDEQSRIAREQHQKEIIEMSNRHAELARKMIEKAEAAVENIDPEKLNPGSLSKIVDVAAKLERISRGDVGEVIEERDGGKVEQAVTFYIPDNGREKEG